MVDRETQYGGWETGWESCLDGKRFNLWSDDDEDPMQPGFPKIDGVIAGGESGPGSRPMHPDWARSLRDQCSATGTDFHFKQWGDWVPDVGAVDGWTIPDDPEVSKYLHRDWEGDHFGEPYARGWMDEVEPDTVSRRSAEPTSEI